MVPYCAGQTQTRPHGHSWLLLASRLTARDKTRQGHRATDRLADCCWETAQQTVALWGLLLRLQTPPHAREAPLPSAGHGQVVLPPSDPSLQVQSRLPVCSSERTLVRRAPVWPAELSGTLEGCHPEVSERDRCPPGKSRLFRHMRSDVGTPNWPAPVICPSLPSTEPATWMGQV